MLCQIDLCDENLISNSFLAPITIDIPISMANAQSICITVKMMDTESCRFCRVEDRACQIGRHSRTTPIWPAGPAHTLTDVFLPMCVTRFFMFRPGLEGARPHVHEYDIFRRKDD